MLWKISDFAQRIIDDAAAWLVPAAIACLLFACAILLAKAGRRTGLHRRFMRLHLAAKTAILALITCLAFWGGAKPGGDSCDAPAPPPMLQEVEAPRSLPPELSAESNLVAITDFAACPANQTLAFEATWETSLFDYTASRDLFLLQSTNLLEQRWAPLGAYTMPAGTNSHAFTVAEADVDAAMRPLFLDALSGGMAFYRLGIDFDSDGDGIADPIERYWTLTAADLADTDADGLSDSEELSVGTDPLVADTDNSRWGQTLSWRTLTATGCPTGTRRDGAIRAFRFSNRWTSAARCSAVRSWHELRAHALRAHPCR